MLTVDGNKVEILQAKKGIPMGKLIKLSGLRASTVYSIKNGKPCKPLSVHKLAKALGADVTEILKERKGANNG